MTFFLLWNIRCVLSFHVFPPDPILQNTIMNRAGRDSIRVGKM